MTQENTLKKNFLVVVNSNKGQSVSETEISEVNASNSSVVRSNAQVLPFQPSMTRSSLGEQSNLLAPPASQQLRSIHAKSVNRMAPTPPPPPPPNPDFQPKMVPSTEPKTDNAVHTSSNPAPSSDSSASDPSVPYDVHTEGPLTYFNYYFEDADFSATRSDELSSSGRSKLSMGIVGAGVLAATLVSGLVIRDAFKTAEPPQDNKPVDANTQQRTTTNSLRPSPSSPERLGNPRSQPSAKSAQPTKPRSTPAPLKKSALPQAEPLPLPNGSAISPPETLALSSASPVEVPKLPAVKLPLPTVNIRESAPLPNGGSASVNGQQTAIRQGNVAAIAKPETMPVSSSIGSNPLQSANLPSNSAIASTAAESTAFPPSSPGSIASTSEASPNVVGMQSPETTGDVENIPNSDTPIVAPGQSVNNLQQLFPPRKEPLTAQSSVELQRVMPQNFEETADGDRTFLQQPQLENEETQNGETQNSPTSINRSVGSEAQAANQPRIRDYLVLPQQLPADKAISLLPLTQKAAEEAATTDRFGPYTVRQVTSQEYQKEWAASNKTVEDPAIALGFPAYGFIDYERRVIVVLQETNKTATQAQEAQPFVRSQKPTSLIQSRKVVPSNPQRIATRPK